MAYAINVADLTGMRFREDYMLTMILGSILNRDPGQVICAGSGRLDEIGARLECEEERAAAIVEIIRTKFKKYELRFYYSKTGLRGWKRV